MLRLLMLAYGMLLCMAAIPGRRLRRRGRRAGQRVLLTGRFDSEAWAMAHLRPMSAGDVCSELRLVTTTRVPLIPKVVQVRPPNWLVRLLGATPARQAVFAWQALRSRPDVIGGFHLLPNGLAAILLGRIVGARSLYVSTGGPVEILGGGVWGEGGPFFQMETPDDFVEQRLLDAVSACDVVVTQGTGGAELLRDRGVASDVHVVTGGIDSQEFLPASAAPDLDMLLVGRLVEIKRIDVFLRVVARVRRQVPAVRAAIVGDGPLRAELERLSSELGLNENVRFAGHRQDVKSWLRRSSVFLLTSRSEGLSLAMIEAMLCGLPAVVSDVGDLADLVEHGVNGYLVPVGSVDDFAAHVVELLTNTDKRRRFSTAARESALRHDLGVITGKWNRIYSGMDQSEPTVSQIRK